MAHALAWFAFLALYCVAVYRWTNDFRDFVAPRLLRLVGRLIGSRVELDGTSSRANGEVDWTVRDASSAKAALASWVSVLTVAIAIFAPVSCVWMAAHFRAISWTTAYPLLFISVSLSCLIWVGPHLKKSGSD